MSSLIASSIYKTTDLDESEEEILGDATDPVPGKVDGWSLYNSHATDTRFVKFYNATAANTVVGTTTPVLTVAVQAGAEVHGFPPGGVSFPVALTIAATTGVADSDTGAPGASEVMANIFYHQKS